MLIVLDWLGLKNGERQNLSVVPPNVANNRIAADREAGCCNSG